MANRHCPDCQQVIVGSGHLYNGKLYCDQCYLKVVQQIEKQENDKLNLFQYIKELFGINEIPESWCYTIDSLLASGKTLAGIRMTLYYYHEILGNQPNSAYGMSIIGKYYEETRQYAIKQKEIQQKNLQHEEKKQVVTVQITRPVSKKKQLSYRIEDL